MPRIRHGKATLQKLPLALGWPWAALTVYGQEHDLVAIAHDFRRDPVEEWVTLFLKIVLTISIAIILYSLVRFRGRVAGRLSWGLLIFGVGVLPTLSVSFGTLLVFERAEKVEFCASCHLTMQSYVDDMMDPDSESMAAVHYKNRYIPSNQCYDCHTSYGMFGTLEAKMAGTIDVYKYYTRTYTLPIKMRHPYSNGDCLKCHAESQKWLGQEMHIENRDVLFSDDISCMECHGPMGRPAHTLVEAE